MAAKRGQVDRILDSLPDGPALLADPDGFEQTLEDGGTVAVTAPPYAGREQLLDHAADALDADRVRLGPGEGETLSDELGTGPVVVDGCHHLYNREIDGFGALREGLEMLAQTETTVITGWNRTAWEYLDRIERVSESIDNHHSVRPFGATEIESLLQETRELPMFEEDTLEDSVFSTATYAIGSGTRTLALPRVDFDILRRRLQPRREASDAVFGRLQALSSGNPGVALALFDEHTDSSLSPSDLTTPSVGLDETGDFLLSLLLANERVEAEWLVDRVGDRTERILGRLDRAGIGSWDGSQFVLEPLGVPTATKRTERRRIL